MEIAVRIENSSVSKAIIAKHSILSQRKFYRGTVRQTICR